MQLDSSTVVLVRCRDYRAPRLEAVLEQVLTRVGCPRDLSSRNVLLKPNLITARHGSLACTEGRFIVAAATCLVERGARVVVGDSPAFGTASGTLDRIGVLEDLRRLGVGVSDFRRIRRVRLPSGATAGLAARALECDLLVNLPRVKAHAQTRVTLAVKNCFGCLVGLRKPWWHMAHGGAHGRFADLLVELLAVLPASLTLVDGIVAMHETGPVRGRPFPLALVAGGANPVAVDTALLRVLGLDPELSPLWQACRRAETGGLRCGELDFPLLRPGEVRPEGFLVPETLNPIRFSLMRFARSTVRRLLHGHDNRQGA
ncbi:MAG TPA: DUF362 domain-containing protein [Desulfobulbus sp.]|nr:DUF362 domain-containing protein [Desulfobulbus sp.]